MVEVIIQPLMDVFQFRTVEYLLLDLICSKNIDLAIILRNCLWKKKSNWFFLTVFYYKSDINFFLIYFINKCFKGIR